MEDNKRRKGITFGKRVGCVLMSIALVLSVCFTRSIPSRAAGGSDGPSFTITGIGEPRLGLAGYFPGTASVRYFNTITVGVPDGYSISLDGSEDDGAVWEEGSHSFTADDLGWTGTTRQITSETLPIWVKGPDGTIYPDDYYYAVFSLIEDAGYSINSLRYDDGAPTISGINTGTEKELSIVDGGTVYAGHTVELTVTDSDLKSVTVNESAAEITEDDYEMPVATFTLEPQSGTPQTVNIQAEDYAGNTKSWTFTLSADQESDYYNMLSVSGLSGPHTVKNTDYPGIESDTVDIYFTKAITVTAPTGYKIKAGYGGSEWGQSVTYVATGDGPDSMEWNEEQEVFGYTTHLIYMVADEDDPEDPMYMYLNELLIRKGSRFEFIKYDADPPTCDVTDQDDNEVALTEDAEIIARELNVLIQDRYLESVKIDGESFDIDTDGDTPTAEITLTVEKGAPAYRHIEATDLAGNTYSRSFTQLYKALPTLTITMDDEIPYGTDYEPDVDTNSTATPVITYQSVNGDHITDLTEKPTEIGEYRVCATVAETDDYDAYEMEWDYAIVKNDSPSSTVSCEDILSAGKVRSYNENHITNYKLAASRNEKLWQSYINNEAEFLLNPDEYDKTILDYAFEFKNYPLLKYLVDNEYIWFVEQNPGERCGMGFYGGTSIERRPLGNSKTMEDQLTGNDSLRRKMIILAIENNDFDMIDEFRAREIPLMYQKLHETEFNKLSMYYDEDLLDAASRASEKVLDYFSEVITIKPAHGQTPYQCMYPFLGEMIEKLIEQKNPYADTILRRCIAHNKNTYVQVNELKCREYGEGKNAYSMFRLNFYQGIHAIEAYDMKQNDFIVTNLIRIDTDLDSDLIKELNSYYDKILDMAREEGNYVF